MISTRPPFALSLSKGDLGLFTRPSTIMKIIFPTVMILLLLSAHNAYAARTCTFSAPATATLNFGSLNPGSPVDVNAPPATLIFKCTGSGTQAYTITDDDGLYETGPNANRMRNTTVITEFLPYTLTYTPSSGSVSNNTNQTLTITGTVTGVNYQNAYVGSYSDTVILTINP